MNLVHVASIESFCKDFRRAVSVLDEVRDE